MSREKNNYEIFYESLYKAMAATMANDPAYFDTLLIEGKMSLLLEEFTNKDAAELTKSLQAQKTVVDAISKAFSEVPNNAMKNSKDIMDGIASEIEKISDTTEIVIMSQKGDTKGLKKKMEQLNAVTMKAGNAASAIVQTLLDAAENLGTVVGNLSQEQKNMSIGDFELLSKSETDPEKKKDMQDTFKILKAVLDSFAVPSWQTSAIQKGASSAKSDAGGLWGAVVSFFKGIGSRVADAIDPVKKAFTADLKGLSIQNIIDIKPKMEEAKRALVPTTTGTSGGVAGASTDVAPPPAGGGPGGSSGGRKIPKSTAKGGLKDAIKGVAGNDAEAIVDKLLKDNGIKDIFSESRRYVPLHSHSLSYLLFERVDFAAILKAVRDAGVADEQKANQIAVAAAKYFKEQGADVEVPGGGGGGGGPGGSGGGGGGPGGGAGGAPAVIISNIQGVVADAGKQALGKTVLDIVKKIAEPYKNQRGMATSIAKLASELTAALERNADEISSNISAELGMNFDKWYQDLDDDTKTRLTGNLPDPEKIEWFKNIKKQIKDAVDANVTSNVKMESVINRRRSINEAGVGAQVGSAQLDRWALLAGIKETKHR